MTETCRLYGLDVSSELPLHQRTLALRPDDPDLRIRVGQPLPPESETPTGQIMAQLAVEAETVYRLVRLRDGGYVLRYFGACDFLVNANLDEVVVRINHGADPGLASVLTTGTLLAFILIMRGSPVLHASTVQIGKHALAFAGSSGMGKSTVAALVCATGGALVTDDVLRLDCAESVVRCHLGATELRLRKSAGELMTLFGVPLTIRRTSDQRDALRVTAATDDLLPLAAIVIPQPDRHRNVVAVRRLPPIDAFLELLHHPRILGWQDPATNVQQFQQLATLCERVPVYLADLPWGPPFRPAIALGVLSAVGLPATPSLHVGSPINPRLH